MTSRNCVRERFFIAFKKTASESEKTGQLNEKNNSSEWVREASENSIFYFYFLVLYTALVFFSLSCRGSKWDADWLKTVSEFLGLWGKKLSSPLTVPQGKMIELKVLARYDRKCPLESPVETCTLAPHHTEAKASNYISLLRPRGKLKHIFCSCLFTLKSGFE